MAVKAPEPPKTAKMATTSHPLLDVDSKPPQLAETHASRHSSFFKTFAFGTLLKQIVFS